MIDYRIHTFLELCDVMNYHQTADHLQMTQPAVTQHIHYLEQQYNCKLFTYQNKKLSKTNACHLLEQHARTLVALHLSAKERLQQTPKKNIRLGATKTIGEYVLPNHLPALLSQEGMQVSITIDNTENLLEKLNHFALDLLLLEGYVDKEKYQTKRMSAEKIVGICAKDHPFAGQSVDFVDLFSKRIVLREEGSGTRAVFEHFLQAQGYSIDAFAHLSFISSNKLIEEAVAQNLALSFVYEVIPKQNQKLQTFHVKGLELVHAFEAVYLHEEKAGELLALIK